jgi:ABC-type amino acid transport substrate-binding protein
MRTRTIPLLIAAALLSSACGSDSESEFDENTPMYAIQQEGTLRIAVPDIRPFGSPDGSDGFSVELGRFIAADMGIEAEVVTADSQEMGQLVALGIVDVAFPLTPLTYDALRKAAPEVGYSFATPYFVAHQKLLVEESSGVKRTADLEGKRVCSYIDRTTQVDISSLVDVDVTQVSDIGECELAMRKGAADAVTASDALLVGLNEDLEQEGPRSYEIVGDELNTEGYAPAVLPGAMAGYVISQLNEFEEDGRWLQLYSKWFEPYLGPADEPPQLTLQDAASLYPPD